MQKLARLARLALPALLAAPAFAQEVALLPTAGPPIQPGATFSVLLQNQSGQPIPYSFDDCVLRILRASGELVRTPAPPAVDCPTSGTLQPFQVVEILLQAPDQPGPYAVVYPFADRAALGFEVVGAATGAPDVVVYPAELVDVEHAHAHDFADPAATPWEVANLRSFDLLFQVGARIEIFQPGGVVPVAAQTLAGILVEPGEVAQVPLDTSGLPPGPYTVTASWTDLITGPQSATHGIRALGSGADLHLFGGRTLSAGDTTELAVAVADFASAPTYALVLGAQPGSLALPGGVVAPVVVDGLVLASLSGLGGFLVNGVGVVPAATGLVDGIRLTHPGAPAAGLEVRAAAITFSASGFGASQPETVRFL